LQPFEYSTVNPWYNYFASFLGNILNWNVLYEGLRVHISNQGESKSWSFFGKNESQKKVWFQFSVRRVLSHFFKSSDIKVEPDLHEAEGESDNEDGPGN
jgi:hypothetical protein